MDQYLSTIIITAITGLVSIITMIIQNRQDKVINKLDEQFSLYDREKTLKQKLVQKEKEREAIIQDVLILILDTNIRILRDIDQQDGQITVDDVFKASSELRSRFEDIGDEISEINKEYALILDISSSIKQQIKKKK